MIGINVRNPKLAIEAEKYLTVEELRLFLMQVAGDAFIAIEHDIAVGVEHHVGRIRQGYYNYSFAEALKGDNSAISFLFDKESDALTAPGLLILLEDFPNAAGIAIKGSAVRGVQLIRGTVMPHQWQSDAAQMFKADEKGKQQAVVFTKNIELSTGDVVLRAI